MPNPPTRPLPARLSPRAGAGTRRFLRRVRRSAFAADAHAAVAAAFWPAVVGCGVLAGLALLIATRGSYVAWDGAHTIPTGGTR